MNFTSLLLPICFLYIILLCSCTRKEEVIPPIINRSSPYDEAFWRKKVKYMLTYRDNDVKHDSTGFDAEGNATFVKQFWHKERMAYDSNHFVVRRLIVTDITDNLIYSYSLKSDTLIQTWTSAEHNKWDLLNAGDSLFSNRRSGIAYTIDKQGRIVSEIDYENKTVLSTLVYSGDLLTEKRYSNGKTIYSYVKSQLSRIENYENDKLNGTIYFNEMTGLPDSARLKYHEDVSYREKYVYGFY